MYNELSVYASVGDNTVLNAVFNITGNPIPSSTWRIKSDNMILPSIGKYSLQIPGQLAINNIAVEDFNVYLFTATNNIGNDVTVEISLLEIGKQLLCLHAGCLQSIRAKM